MKQEDIKKAANDFSEREYEVGDIDKDALHKGFYHGAEWRINSVWHDVKEKPNGIFVILIDLGCRLGDEEYSFGITLDGCEEAKRWAYVKDLLPNKED